MAATVGWGATYRWCDVNAKTGLANRKRTRRIPGAGAGWGDDNLAGVFLTPC